MHFLIQLYQIVSPINNSFVCVFTYHLVMLKVTAMENMKTGRREIRRFKAKPSSKESTFLRSKRIM